MKALSIKQPWANLIAHGIKDIENRTWRTNFRGRIYIHASQKCMSTPAVLLLTGEQIIASLSLKQWRFPCSAIIGEVDIVDCVTNHESIWADKDPNIYLNGKKVNVYNWVLANAVLYDEPVLNVKGKLSLWEFE